VETRLWYVLRGFLAHPSPDRSYEVKFYERAQDPEDLLHPFLPFVPVFKGVKQMESEEGVATEYLVMNDLLAPYKNPACMDVKVGK
jgi:hypothetical protein